jgi:hypothetical protein
LRHSWQLDLRKPGGIQEKLSNSSGGRLVQEQNEEFGKDLPNVYVQNTPVAVRKG